VADNGFRTAHACRLRRRYRPFCVQAVRQRNVYGIRIPVGEQRLVGTEVARNGEVAGERPALASSRLATALTVRRLTRSRPDETARNVRGAENADAQRRRHASSVR
jgi:hypothetical protein